MNWRAWRRQWLTETIYRMAREAMPRLSATAKEAIEAGDVWWDAQLFSGKRDWRTMLEVQPVSLKPPEKAFMDGPAATVCRMRSEEHTSELRQLMRNYYDLIS